MKNYFFLQTLILTGLFNTVIRAMDDEQKSQKPFSLCKQILTIDPNAPVADYKALAQRLHDAKLSTCECATYLTHEKKQKALIALKKEGFLSENGIKRINEFQDEIKKIKEPLNKLVVEIPEHLPEDIKEEIIDHFSPRFSPIKFKINEFLLQSSAGIIYDIPPKFRYSKKPLKNINFEHSLLIIGYGFQYDSLFRRKSTYLHEEQHIISRHGLTREILHNELIRKLRNKDNNENFPRKLHNFGKLQDKFSRALETEADLIPTACGNCNDAYSAVEDFETLPKGDRKHHNTHPSNLTRYKRAQRIYNLKLAEEEIIQKEEPQLL